MIVRRKFLWHAGSFRLELGEKTLVMGIVNVTPDSFSGDGVLVPRRKEKIPGFSRALELVDEGADILDVGGESSRPGALVLSVQEELGRVLPLVKMLVKSVKVPVSVDTYKPMVARQALDAGASIVNLIQGTPEGGIPLALLKVVKRSGAGFILMHMRGDPRTMQTLTSYHDVVRDVKRALKKTLDNCLGYGIKRDSIVVDPGIGFAKTAGQSLVILQRLNELASLRIPVLVGTSRKSFIGKTLGVDVDDRLTGTAATVALAVACGAHMVRVHDVKAMKQAVLMADAVGMAK